MRLSERLEKIVNLIEKCNTAADVGTDHALVPIALIKKNICNKVIAADINQGPLLMAKENIKSNQCEDRIETRLGFGLEVIKPGEAQTIVIAGMGGLMIIDILEQGKETAQSAENLILQPMTHHFELREWLLKNNYIIKDEELIQDEEKFYLILKVSYGTYDYEAEDNPYFGHILFDKKHLLLGKYIMKNITELENIKVMLLQQHTVNSERKLKEVEEKIREYKSLYKKTLSYLNMED